MFDVGFSEMVVIAVVALIVIGPERLPGVARTIGHLLGRLNRYVSEVKADINREMELDELRKFKEQFQDVAQSAQNTIHDELASARDSVESMGRSPAGLTGEPANSLAVHAEGGSGNAGAVPAGSDSSPESSEKQRL